MPKAVPDLAHSPGYTWLRTRTGKSLERSRLCAIGASLPVDCIHDPLNRGRGQIPDSNVRLIVSIEGAQCYGKAVGAAADDLERNVSLVAVDPDE